MIHSANFLKGLPKSCLWKDWAWRCLQNRLMKEQVFICVSHRRWTLEKVPMKCLQTAEQAFFERFALELTTFRSHFVLQRCQPKNRWLRFFHGPHPTSTTCVTCRKQFHDTLRSVADVWPSRISYSSKLCMYVIIIVIIMLRLLDFRGSSL